MTLRGRLGALAVIVALLLAGSVLLLLASRTAGCAVAGLGFLVFGRMADRLSAQRVVGVGVMILVVGSFASALAVGWAPAFVLASSVLGMGASGTRLGAELVADDVVLQVVKEIRAPAGAVSTCCERPRRSRRHTITVSPGRA